MLQHTLVDSVCSNGNFADQEVICNAYGEINLDVKNELGISGNLTSSCNSAKILRRKCIVSMEILKTKLHECIDHLLLGEALDKLADLVKRLDSSLCKDPSQKIPLTVCKTGAFCQRSKGLTVENESRNIRPLRHKISQAQAGELAIMWSLWPSSRTAS